MNSPGGGLTAILRRRKGDEPRPGLRIPAHHCEEQSHARLSPQPPDRRRVRSGAGRCRLDPVAGLRRPDRPRRRPRRAPEWAPVPAAGRRSRRPAGPSARVRLHGGHLRRQDDAAHGRADAVQPRRHGGIQRRSRRVAADPEPRARSGLAAGRPARHRHRLRPGCGGRWWLHGHRDRPSRQESRRVGRHLRHGRELRRRPDPLGQLADLRGDRDQGRCRLERQRAERHLRQGPRLRVRGLRRRAVESAADQGFRPLRARGPGCRPRPRPGLPLRGRQQPQRPLLPLDRPARPAPAGRPGRPARPHRRDARGDGDHHGRRLGAPRRRLPHLCPARPAVPGALGRDSGARRPDHLGAQAVRRPDHPRQEVRRRLRNPEGCLRRQ